MPVTHANLDRIFGPAHLSLEQQNAATQLSARAKQFAQAILDFTPQCADQQAALRLVRQAHGSALNAICLGGEV